MPQNAHFCTYMTKSGGGTICISVPPLQILGGLVPLSPLSSPVIYAHDLDHRTQASRKLGHPWTLGRPFNTFILLNGWISLHSVF